MFYTREMIRYQTRKQEIREKMIQNKRFKIGIEDSKLLPSMTHNYDTTGHETSRGAWKQAYWPDLKGHFYLPTSHKVLHTHHRSFTQLIVTLMSHDGMIWEFGVDQRNGHRVRNKLFCVKNLRSYINNSHLLVSAGTLVLTITLRLALFIVSTVWNPG